MDTQPTKLRQDPIRDNRPHLLRLSILAGLIVILVCVVTIYGPSVREEGYQGVRTGIQKRIIPSGFAFDLSTCNVPLDTLLPGGVRKDGIPAISNPQKIDITEADHLDSSDRVVGVAIGGEAMAYPIRILNYHECVNDRVGGKAIAVTYCPLCDSAFVFDRHIGGLDVEFGISGLLLNSNVLLYDRHEKPEDESLWTQVGMRAVCGPAAAASAELVPLPAELVSWGDWKTRHPGTKVQSFETGFERPYTTHGPAGPYAGYFTSTNLMFPVRSLRESVEEDLPDFQDKEPSLVVWSGDHTKVYPQSEVAKKADDAGVLKDRVGETDLSLIYDDTLNTLRLESLGSETPATAYTFWFAWESLQDGYEIYQADAGLVSSP